MEGDPMLTQLDNPSLLLPSASTTSFEFDGTLMMTPFAGENVRPASSSSSSFPANVLLPEFRCGEAAANGGNVNKNKGKGKRSAATPRISFHTRSADDILDDGYRWRKYGQKSVKNNIHPRSYYRCTYHTCNVKKQVQRLAKDPSIVVTTYEGIHNHPCEKLMETLSPLLRQLQFLTRV